jgi:DNA repair exonuclease SbcCD ATPase subunit
LAVTGQQTAERVKELTTALEQVKADGIVAIDKLVSAAEDRVKDGVSRFESLIATEKNAKEAAEQAIRAARAALVKVSESEAKLSEAQEAAINIEATASASLAAVHKQVKRIEEAVGTVVIHGIERAQTDVQAIVNECRGHIESTASACLQSTAEAKERIERETAETLQTVADREAGALAAVESACQSAQRVAAERIESARQAVDEAATDALRLVSEVQSAALAELRQKLENARGEMDTAQNSLMRVCGEAASELGEMRKTIIQDLNTRTEAAGDRIDGARKAVNDAATCAMSGIQESQAAAIADLRKQLDEATTTMQQTCADAVSRMDETRQSAERACEETADHLERGKSVMADDLRQKIEEAARQLDALVESSAQRLSTLASENAEAAGASITATSEAEAEKIRQTASSVAAGAIERVGAAATRAASGIQERIGAATQMARKLREIDTQTRGTVAEAATCREKIDHLIRDVWSLTSTTDQRARALAALSDSLQSSERNIEKLVQRADARSADLATRTSEAEQSAQRLASAQGQAITACSTLSERIKEFTAVHGQLAEKGEAGRKVHEELAAQADELKSLVVTAGTIVHNILDEHEKAERTTELVHQLTEAAAKIQTQINDLSTALANPFAVIKEARDQADELNGICLAVKRVFRGVSQASLEANERIKVLARFLTASERSSETIKQWVEEAGRAQARLAAMLRQVPSLDETHPIVALPEMSKGAYPSELRGSAYNAEDMATVRRIAGIGGAAGNPGDNPVSFEAKHVADTRVGAGSGGAGATTQKMDKPPRNDTGTRPAKSDSASQAGDATAPSLSHVATRDATTLEHVQRLLKAADRKSPNADEAVAAVRKSNESANQSAVISAAQGAAGATRGTQTRLRPEDVKALIEAAKKKPAAKS